MVQEKTGLLTPADPISIFYGDVPEPLASQSAAALLPVSMYVFKTPAPAPAWADAAYSGRCAYLRCSKDAAIPGFLQDLMMNGSGVDWLVYTFETSHSPFLKCPSDVTHCLMTLAAEFQG